MFRRTPLAAAAAAAAVALATGSVQAQSGPRFTLETLPTLGGSTNSAAAVNDAGQVVGQADNAFGWGRAYIWHRGTGMVALPGFALQESAATALSERGQASGHYNSGSSAQPFLWTPGVEVQELPMLFDQATVPGGVNDSGVVVGTTFAGNQLPSRWSQSTGVVALPVTYISGQALAINNAGQAVGQIGNMNLTVPVVWSASNQRTTLRSELDGEFGAATAINNLGQVAGWYTRPGQADGTVPFIWSAEGGTRLLQGNGAGLYPTGNNDAGLVVGRQNFPGNGNVAVAWRPDGGLVDLAALTGADLRSAHDANNHAQIVINSLTRGHLLTLHPDWVGGDGNWADNTGTHWNFAGMGAAGVVGIPHDVLINPGVSATVRGAAQGMALSLRVGGTVGQVVVLDLNGGTTTVGTRTSLDEGGVLRGAGRHQGDVSIGGQGRLEVGAGQTMQVAGDMAQQGVVDLRADTGQARLHVTGSWVARGQTQLMNAELRADGGMSNDGLLHVTGFSQVLGRVDNRSSGRIQVSGAAGEAVFWDDVVNNGNVNVTSNSTATFFGAVSGAGGFSGAGTKHFAGGYNPGNSPGRATLEGAVVFDGGTLLMELAGVTAGTQHDKLVFENASVLLRGGVVLNLVLLDGYSPVLGDQFDLFDWNGSLEAASGSFGELLLPTLAGGLVWDVSRLYLSGDIGVTAVPEPQTWALMALGLMGVALRRRDTTAAQQLQVMRRMAH